MYAIRFGVSLEKDVDPVLGVTGTDENGVDWADG